MLPADIGSGGPACIDDAEVADTASAALDRAERGGEMSWSLRIDLNGADITVGIPFLDRLAMGPSGLVLRLRQKQSKTWMRSEGKPECMTWAMKQYRLVVLILLPMDLVFQY